jgi:hypothetical protein
MPFDNAAKSIGLTAIANAADGCAIHSADPGTGSSNETSATRLNPTFAAASGNSIALASALEFTGATANAGATWFTVWQGSTRLGKGQITSGDTQFNAEGEFHLTTGTSLRIDD